MSDFAGSPHIDHSILKRIRDASAMVADISLVGNLDGGSGKRTANPNVMFEVGYAFATMGTERVILVRGDDLKGDLPFDVSHYRYMAFEKPEDLAKGLERGLLKILQAPPGLPGSEMQRNLVLRLIAQGAPKSYTERAELANELLLLASNEKDIWFQLPEHYRTRGRPDRGNNWKPYFVYPDKNELTNDIRLLLNVASSGDTKEQAHKRMKQFLASEELNLARDKMRDSIDALKSSLSGVLAPAKVPEIVETVSGSERLGLSPQQLLASCEESHVEPDGMHRVLSELIEFREQFDNLGDPLDVVEPDYTYSSADSEALSPAGPRDMTSDS